MIENKKGNIRKQEFRVYKEFTISDLLESHILTIHKKIKFSHLCEELQLKYYIYK